MSITKAIIPVAGWGTRRLPVTKSIEKCMLPIANRPVVDYVVQDAIMAGITEIFFVVGKDSLQIQNYYGRNERLEGYLQNSGDTEFLRYIQPPQNVKFYYIEQDSTQRYGTAIPVGLCAPYVEEGESVAVIMGDDFVYNPEGSELWSLISQTPDGQSGMLVSEVPQSRVQNYGVVEYDSNGNYYQIVEKPRPEEAPSNHINTSTYVFSYDLLKQIEGYSSADISGEFKITDPINQHVLSGGIMNVAKTSHKYLDAGDVYAWHYANAVVLGIAK